MVSLDSMTNSENLRQNITNSSSHHVFTPASLVAIGYESYIKCFIVLSVADACSFSSLSLSLSSYLAVRAECGEKKTSTDTFNEK